MPGGEDDWRGRLLLLLRRSRHWEVLGLEASGLLIWRIGHHVRGRGEEDIGRRRKHVVMMVVRRRRLLPWRVLRLVEGLQLDRRGL